MIYIVFMRTNTPPTNARNLEGDQIMAKKLTKRQRVARDRIIEHVVWWYTGGDLGEQYNDNGHNPLPFGSLVGGCDDNGDYDEDTTFGEVVSEFIG